MTENHPLDCSHVRAFLDDLVDGALPENDREALDAHLVDCAACRGEEASLRALLAMAEALPSEVAAGRDLWPGIAGRLASPATPVVLPFRRRVVERLRPVALALAAVLLMAVGGALTHFVVEPRLAGSTVAPAIAEGPSAADVALAADRGAADVELEVLRAKEALWRAAYRGRVDLTPETIEIVEGNLRVLDEAIAELRAALVADPHNPHLTGLLVASHRREIALLERLSRPSEV